MRRNSLPGTSRSRDRSLQRWAERWLGGAQQPQAQVFVHNDIEPQPAGPENLDEIAVADILQPELAREEQGRAPRMPARPQQIGAAHLEYASSDPLGRLLLQIVRDNMELRQQAGAREEYPA